MGQILAVVRFAKKSGLPKDAVQNSFAFTTGQVPPSGAELDEIGNRLDNFYNANGSLGAPIVNWFADSVSRVANAHSISYYDLTGHLDGTPHGSPIRTTPLTIVGAGGQGSLPDEVAVCMSVHSAFGTDREAVGATRPKARDRGRIYIGPLATNAISAPAPNNEAVVTPNLVQTIKDAHVALNTSQVLATWVLWSRKAAALKPIVGGFVDNAFDTQRRRGNAATSRMII